MRGTPAYLYSFEGGGEDEHLPDGLVDLDELEKDLPPIVPVQVRKDVQKITFFLVYPPQSVKLLT